MIVFRFCPRSSRSKCFLRQKRNLSFSQWLRVSSPVTSYKDTILLPRTPFPARVEGQSRVQLDQEVINEAGFRKLYQRQHDDRADQEYYVLHDGPPYANGDPHLGHAVNKILKDVTARWQVVKGKRVHFRPGWDCHGLPIELKAVKGGNSESTPNPLNIRSVARTFARQTIERQKAEFVSWGVMADWDNPYVTMDPDCVKQEIRAFYQLFKKGFVYQSYMPVYWSPSSQTALAESELEYNPSHQSVSAYVRFTLDQVPSSVKQAVQGEPCHLLAWTTTPWSLTANKAICFNPEAEYVIVRKVSGSSEVGEAECYVVSKTLLSSSNDLKEIFGESPEVVFAGTGADMLSDATYKQVLANGVSQSLPVLPASHVTTDSGTGLVHTAPAHGQDDYLVGIGHKLDLSCCVDDQGCLDETVSPPELRGLSVLDPETSRTVLRVLGDSVLKSSVISHSYPYDWRTKEPVILKASKQWFIDTKSLQKDALEAVKSIRIHPRTATNGFKGVLERRPYWCISRQRVWGVPIPVMYTSGDENGTPVVSEELIERYCQLIDEHGPDFWWSMEESEILEGLSTGMESRLVKGRDILDVWFDSGLTWSHAIPPTKTDDSPALRQSKVYLEGLDQFSGWFYSSLMIGLALQGAPPYSSLYVHGFTLDQDGRKMSKSLGNVVSPSQITKGGLTEKLSGPAESGQNKKSKKKGAKGGGGASSSKVYGVDVLRWWVAANASQNAAILVGDGLLAQTKTEVDRLRNVFKFILGNLSTESEPIERYDELLLLDKYILHQLALYLEDVARNYDEFAYNLVILRTQNFVASTLSGFYFHLVKDRLYCDHPNSIARRSAVTTLSLVLEKLKFALHPVVPILTSEVGSYCKPSNGDAHFTLEGCETIWENASWQNPEAVKLVDQLSQTKAMILKAITENTDDSSKPITDMKNYDLEITSKASSPRLWPSDSELSELFQSASVTTTSCQMCAEENTSEPVAVVHSECGTLTLCARPTTLLLCPRCRLMSRGKCEQEICDRCLKVVSNQ